MKTNKYTDPLKDQYHILNNSRSQERLKRLGTTKVFPAGYIFDYRDRIPDRLFVIVSGKIRVFEDSYEGEHRIYNLMYPGSIMMEEYVLFPKPCPVLFETITECELVQIERCDLIRAMKGDIDTVLDIMESLSCKFVSAMEDQRVGPRQKAEWRICRVLLSEMENSGRPYKGGILLKEKISHQMLADILGMNRVTMTRKINKLTEMGLIDRVKGYFFIPNIQAFQFYMEELEKI